MRCRDLYGADIRICGCRLGRCDGDMGVDGYGGAWAGHASVRAYIYIHIYIYIIAFVSCVVCPCHALKISLVLEQSACNVDHFREQCSRLW